MAQVTEKLKTSSAKWSKSLVDGGLYWQSGYGAFSVGVREVDQIAAYIRNQEEHHRKWSFQDELRQLLQDHEIEFDERYLWDYIRRGPSGRQNH